MKTNFMKKVIATVLSIIMVLYSIEIAGVLTAYAENEKGKDKISLEDFVPDDAEKRSSHIKHLDQYDTENMSVYLNEDGTATFYVFQSPVRFKDSNGKLIDFDTTLVETSSKEKEQGYNFKSKANDVDVLLPEHLLGDDGVKLKKNDYSIEIIPVPVDNLEKDDMKVEEPTLTPEPSITPNPDEITASPELEISEEPTITPETSSTPTVEPTVSPTPEETISPEPTLTPEPAPSPSLEPTITPEPTSTPEVSTSPETTSTIEPTPTESPDLANNSGNISLSTKTVNYPTNVVLSKEKDEQEKEDQEKKKSVWGDYKAKDSTEVEKKFKVKIKDDKEKEDKKADYLSEENTDITYSYSAINSGIKENIVINKYTGQNTFDFVIIAPGLDVIVNEYNIIEFRDEKTKEIIFISNEPFAVDSYAGSEEDYYKHYCEDITVKVLANYKDEYRIRIEVPKEFLEAKTTVYPVSVDPSVVVLDNNGPDIYDTFINSQRPTQIQSTNPSMYIGGYLDSEYGVCWGLVKPDVSDFTDLGVPANNITSTTLSLHTKPSPRTANMSLSFYLRAYRLLHPCNPNTETWNTFQAAQNVDWQWNGNEYSISNDNAWYALNITDMMKNWTKYSQDTQTGYPNYGLMLREKDDTAGRMRKFGSVDCPYGYDAYITIQYEFDSQAPQAVTNIGLSAEGFTADENNPGQCKATLEWDGTYDNPSGASYSSAGVKDYLVYYSTDGTNYTAYDDVWIEHLGENIRHEKELSNLSCETEYTFKVVARDLNVDPSPNVQTISEAGLSSALTTPDFTAPKKPNDFNIIPNTWTSDMSPLLYWSGVGDDSIEVLTYEYSIDNPNGTWYPIGTVSNNNSSNLISNSNFADGTTGWTQVNGTNTVDEYVLTHTGNGNGTTGSANYSTSTAVVEGHKIYIKARMRVTNSDAESILIQIDGSSGGTNTEVDRIDAPLENQWYTLSGIKEVQPDFTGNNKILLRHVYADASTESGKQLEVDGSYGNKVVLVDLTAIYGAGNEPDKLTCDALYGSQSYKELNLSSAISTSGEYDIYIRAKDASNNIGEYAFDELYLDIDSPIANIDFPTSSSVVEGVVSIQGDVSDSIELAGWDLKFAPGTSPSLSEYQSFFSEVSALGSYNELENPNFNSATGWQANSNATISVANNIMTVEGNGNSYNPALQQFTDFDTIEGHVIYIYTKLRVTNSDCGWITMALSSDQAWNWEEPVYLDSPQENTWYSLSSLHTINSGYDGNLIVNIFHSYSNSATADGKCMEVDGSDTGIVVLDLTEMYGSGNEPTLAECNEKYNPAANNKIRNANFDTLAHWQASNGTISESNNVISIEANGNSYNAALQQYTNYDTEEGHIIYIYTKVRVTNSDCGWITMAMSSDQAWNWEEPIYLDSPQEDTWYGLSGLHTINSGYDGNLIVSIYHSYSDSATADGKCLEVDGTNGFEILDLTEIYGAGNEPSLAECNEKYNPDANNAVKNARFDTLAHWENGDSSTLTASENILSIQGNGSSYNPAAIQYTDLETVEGHVLYIASKVKVDSPECGWITMALSSDEAWNWEEPIYIDEPETNQWYVMSGLHTIDSGYDGKLIIYLAHSYESNELSSGNIMEVDGRDKGIVAIDLTAVYGSGNEPDKITCDEIYSDIIYSKTNNVLHEWNMTADELEDGSYTLWLHASDKAGNYADDYVTFTKSQVSNASEPELVITNPDPNDENPIAEASPYIVTYTRDGGNADGLTDIELYVNGELVDSIDDTTEDLSIDFTDENYLEGERYYIYVKATDGSNVKYTSQYYETPFYDYMNDTSKLLLPLDDDVELLVDRVVLKADSSTGEYPVDTNGFAVLSDFSNPIEGYVKEANIKASLIKPAGTDISFEVSNDGINYQTLDLTGIDFENDGIDVVFTTVGDQIIIRATLSTTDVDETPAILWWSADVEQIYRGSEITVKLIDEPTDVSAVPEVNYKTLIRWKDEANPEGTVYNVYRGTTEDFIIDDSTLVGDHVEEKFFYDYNLNYNQTYYYKVTSVVEYTSGETSYERESILSNSDSATMIDGEEFDKRFGLQDYWNYTGFVTGSGSGQVELSQGNLSYQTTDFVFPGPMFAMVMRRTYNSQSTSKTAMGYGTDYSFNTALMMEYNSSDEEVGVILKDGDGTIHRFAKTETGYSSPAGVFIELTHENEGLENELWRISRKDGIDYIFDKNMLLDRFEDRNGNYLEYSYNSKGNIETITDNAGNSITLGYNTVDLLTTITVEGPDPQVTTDDRVYKYTYLADATGKVRLAGRELEGESYFDEDFEYNPTTGRLQTIIDGEGHEYTIYYTANDVTISMIEYPVNSASTENFTISYDETNSETTVSFKGNDTEYEYNSNGCVTSITNAIDVTTSYSYNAQYQITNVSYYNIVGANTTAEEISTSVTYDSHNNISTVTDDEGNVITYNYINPSDQVTYNEFDSPYSMTVTSAASGEGSISTSYTYDSNGNVLTTTDAENGTVTNTYYSGEWSSSNKGYPGQLHTTTDRYGSVSAYEYTVEGWLYRAIDDNGEDTVYQYDGMGNPILITDAENNITKVDYDLIGRKVKVYYPDGDSDFTDGTNDTERWVYNNNGNVTYHYVGTGSEEVLTRYTYDDMNRLTHTYHNTDVTAEATVNYDYIERTTGVYTLKVTYTDREGIENIEYYDSIGRLVESKTTNGALSTNVTEYTYDNIGNMIEIVDGEGRVVQAQYDALNRTIKTIVDPGTGNLNLTSEYEYDYLGRTTKTIDGEGAETDYTYDDLSRLLSVTQSPDGGTTDYVTSYTYDTVSGDYLISEIEDAEGGITQTWYDNLGRVYKEVNDGTDDSDSLIIESYYYYDALGRLTYKTFNDGTVLGYTYDSKGYLWKEKYYDSYSDYSDEDGDDSEGDEADRTYTDYTFYEYDSRGNLIRTEGELDDEEFYHEWAYNTRNWVTQQTENITIDGSTVQNVISYGYWDNGQLKSITYPASYGDDQNTVQQRYFYNGYGQLSGIMLDENESRTYTYDDSGMVIQTDTFIDVTDVGDVMSAYFTYNDAGLATDIQYKLNGTLKEQYQYGYDDNGMITSETLTPYGSSTNISKTHVYDDIGRLSQTTIDSTTTSYTYDDIGNRLTESDGTDTTSYTYDALYQLQQMDLNSNKEFEYDYDSLGRQTSQREYNTSSTLIEEQTFTYHDSGMLMNVLIEDSDGSADDINESYLYNGQGQRITKEFEQGTNTAVTQYLYSGSAVIMTADSAGIKITENILTPSGQIISSQRFDVNGDSEGWYSYNYDQRGSTTAIVDSSGTVQNKYSYDAFGNTAETGALLNETEFTGAISDGTTGLYYMNARYYNSNTGRFISQDSYKGSAYEPWTQNLYTYTGNNPVNYTDPTGHWSVTSQRKMLLDGGMIWTEPDTGGGNDDDDGVVPDPEPEDTNSPISGCFSDTGTCGSSEYENDTQYNHLIDTRNSLLIELNGHYDDMQTWLDIQDELGQKNNRLKELYLQRNFGNTVIDMVNVAFVCEFYIITGPDAIVSAVDSFKNLGGEIIYNDILYWYYGCEADWAEGKYYDDLWWYQYYDKKIQNY